MRRRLTLPFLGSGERCGGDSVSSFVVVVVVVDRRSLARSLTCLPFVHCLNHSPTSLLFPSRAGRSLPSMLKILFQVLL